MPSYAKTNMKTEMGGAWNLKGMECTAVAVRSLGFLFDLLSVFRSVSRVTRVV
jgi:hypothetical protein